MGHHEVDDAELELVRGLRARHNQSVATFLERYRPLLLHCIGSFEQDHSTRDDLFQDVVLHVFDRLDADAFDPTKGSFGTWLYRVAWCRVVDLRRRESGGRKVRLTMTGDQIPERADQAPGPSDTASTDEVGQLVRRGLAHLDPEDRVLLVLRFVEGRTMEEIASRTGLSLEQAKYRVKRASTALRRVLVNDLAVEEAEA
jgi:RNA polymerase sigma-70 factor (ECF subfamily)